MKNHILLFNAFFVVFFVLFGVKAYSASAWTAWQDVDVFFVQKGTFVRFKPYTSHIDPNGCEQKSWYKIADDHVDRDDFIKILLTAKASGKKARVLLVGCAARDADSPTTYPIVGGVMIN